MPKPLRRDDNTSYINKVTCGDCLDLMPRLASGSVPLILTDIPYGEVNRKSNGLRSLDKKDADTTTFELDPFLDECCRVLSGTFYIFCGTEQVSHIRSTFVKQGLSTRLCVWEKTNPSPMNGQRLWLSSIECCVFGKRKNATFTEHCKSSVWRFPTQRGVDHPTPKPLKLCEYLIGVSSNPGDTVLDPCVGSGTTCVAAKNLGRNFIGFDNSPDYCRLAKERLQAA